MSECYYASLTMLESDYVRDEVYAFLERTGYPILEDRGEGQALFVDSEAWNGEFDEFEEKLVELKIPYDRYTEPTLEDDAVIHQYRPDVKGLDEIIKDVAVDVNKIPFVSIPELQAIIYGKAGPLEKLMQLEKLINQHNVCQTLEYYALL
jgi:hypothetical protein